MNIKDLEYFHLLVSLKSFTQVAKKLNVSQPTVTYAIKRLEDYYGRDLVLRDQAHHLVTITPSGEILDNHIKKIRKELDLIDREFERLEVPKIDIGLPPIIGNYYVAKLSALFLEKKLQNDINFISGGSQEMFQLLKNGRLTLSLIGSTKPIVSEHLHCELLAKKDFVIVVNPAHPFANKKGLYFSELKNESFVMLNEHFIHANAFKQLSKQNDFSPNIVYQSNDLNILKAMIAQNAGIGFLTEIAIQDTDSLIAIPLLDSPKPQFLISLVQSDSLLPSHVQETIVSLIREMHLRVI